MVVKDGKCCPGFGRKGITEWGFMSTTTNLATAIQYSGVHTQQKKAAIISMELSSVDRGADVSFCSQYPREKEVLFSPCTFLQQSGPQELKVTNSGVLSMFPVRINVNLRSGTLDDIESRKRKMHVSAFKFMIGEIREDLEITADKHQLSDRISKDRSLHNKCIESGIICDVKDTSEFHDRRSEFVEFFCDSIAKQCESVLQRHEDVEDQRYTDNHCFQGLVTEMMELRKMALSKLNYYIEQTSLSMENTIILELRACHRAILTKRQSNLRSVKAWSSSYQTTAIEICQLKGLLVGNVDDLNEMGEPRLVRAAAEGISLNDIQLLIDAGAKIDQQVEQEGVNALHRAARGGHTEIVQFLIDNQANVDHRDNHGWTVLMKATASGVLACVELLIREKADVNAHSSEKVCSNAMIIAADHGFNDIIQLLLQAKASATALLENADSPLHRAVHEGNVDCIRTLVKAGADLHAFNKSNRSPLILAIRRSHKKSVLTLIQAGANVDQQDIYNEDPLSPLAHAISVISRTKSGYKEKKCEEEVVKLLLHANADADGGKFDSLNCLYQTTPLMVAVKATVDENEKEMYVRMLITAKADVNRVDKNGYSALMHAVRCCPTSDDDKSKGLVSLLIQSRADMNLREKESNMTALVIAARFGHHSSLEIILEEFDGLDSEFSKSTADQALIACAWASIHFAVRKMGMARKMMICRLKKTAFTMTESEKRQLDLQKSDMFSIMEYDWFDGDLRDKVEVAIDQIANHEKKKGDHPDRHQEEDFDEAKKQYRQVKAIIEQQLNDHELQMENESDQQEVDDENYQQEEKDPEHDQKQTEYDFASNEIDQLEVEEPDQNQEEEEANFAPELTVVKSFKSIIPSIQEPNFEATSGFLAASTVAEAAPDNPELLINNQGESKRERLLAEICVLEEALLHIVSPRS